MLVTGKADGDAGPELGPSHCWFSLPCGSRRGTVGSRTVGVVASAGHSVRLRPRLRRWGQLSVRKCGCDLLGRLPERDESLRHHHVSSFCVKRPCGVWVLCRSSQVWGHSQRGKSRSCSCGPEGEGKPCISRPAVSPARRAVGVSVTGVVSCGPGHRQAPARLRAALPGTSARTRWPCRVVPKKGGDSRPAQGGPHGSHARQFHVRICRRGTRGQTPRAARPCSVWRQCKQR